MSHRMQIQKQKESFVLAYDFGGTKLALATAIDHQVIVERAEISTVECQDAENALSRAIQLGQDIVQKTKEKTLGGELSGIGIATIGITSPHGVTMAPNIPGWANLRIERSMQDAFPNIPIHIANDVKAAALAELRTGALKGKNVGLYVNLGTGISIAYTLDDRVLQGHHGAAGEIAYFLRNKDEPYGVHEGVAPLEEFVGGRAIGQRASKFFGEEMSAKDLFIRSAQDERARKFVEETLKELAFHLTNVIISWDPETVVLGGGMTLRNDVILPYLEKQVRKFVPFPPDLRLAHYGQDASLHGAIELTLS